MGILSGTTHIIGHSRPATTDSRLGRRRERESDVVIVPADEAWYRPDPLARVAILTGNRGDGKSATANHWAYLMKYTNLNRRIPWKVFANINIQYADEWAEDMYERIQDDKTGWYQNATVVIDELPEIMNSKRSVSGAVVAVEAQLRQLRKDMMDLLGTAQWPHELTSSILRQTDLLIQPRLFKKKVRGLDGQWREIAMVKSAIWNWNGSLTGRPLFGMKWPAPYETADQFRTDFGIENTWNYYSTDSKVQNIHTDAGKQAAVDRKRDREFQELAMSLMNGRNKVPYEEFQIFAGTYLDCDNPTMFAEAARVMRLVVTESDGQQFVELPSAVMEHLDTPAAKQARFEVEMENLRLYG